MIDIDNSAKISFLSSEENACIQLLISAQKLFNRISNEDPQDPSDTYNFGHYLTAARNAVIIRGARRLDPVNLLPKRALDADVFGTTATSAPTELYPAIRAEMKE